MLQPAGGYLLVISKVAAAIVQGDGSAEGVLVRGAGDDVDDMQGEIFW
ncbi:hypothetical protein [Dyella sp.]